MSDLLDNKIMVSLELAIVEDILKIIGQAVHSRFTHDEIGMLQQRLRQRGQEAVDAYKKSYSEISE